MLTYLDLQNIITAKSFVMHLVISVIGIATTLVFDKGKETTRGRPRGRNIATNESPIAKQNVSTMNL